MTMTTRIPTMIAKCGCPYDPEYDEGYLGWHLPENHPEVFRVPITRKRSGVSWVDCVGPSGWCYDGEASEHLFQVNRYFAPNLTGPTHMLVCERCGMHLHADFEVSETAG